MYKFILFRFYETCSNFRWEKVHPDVSLVLSPGSSNIMKMISENGALAKFIAAGARLLEAACGPCIGMGQAPKTDGISLRTFNRNFKGRCGTMSAGVYLVSTETAAASAITGYLTDPRELGAEIIIDEPENLKFQIIISFSQILMKMRRKRKRICKNCYGT